MTNATVSGQNYDSQNAGQPWSYAETAPGVYRFEVRSGDVWQYDPSSKNRSELHGQTQYPAGTQIDMSYDLTIAPGPANTAGWLVINQFHDSNDSAGYSPPFEIAMDGGENMGVNVNYLVNGQQAYKNVYRDASPIVRNHTYHFDIQATFDLGTGSAKLLIKRDGATIVDYRGPMGFPSGKVYNKFGIYRAASAETMIATYSGMSIVTGVVPVPVPVPTPTPVPPPPPGVPTNDATVAKTMASMTAGIAALTLEVTAMNVDLAALTAAMRAAGYLV
jgi:hypothetical protein